MQGILFVIRFSIFGLVHKSDQSRNVIPPVQKIETTVFHFSYITNRLYKRIEFLSTQIIDYNNKYFVFKETRRHLELLTANQ